MTVLEKRPLGRTGLTVPPLCVGTSALGSLPRLYGYDVETDQALVTLRAVFDGPIPFVDTSNSYGNGESERRIGAVLRELGGLPDDFLLSTKVDPDRSQPVLDFSGTRMRASLDESSERLGIDYFPLVYLHDPERISFEEATAEGGPVEALVQLRDEGRIGHIGVAGGPVELLQRFVGLGVFEAVITHNRFTLLNRSAVPLLDQCAAAGVAVVNGAPFGGGILAKGPEAAPRYAYRELPDELRDSVIAMSAACDRAGVPLAAAALQFSMRDPRISATIVGITRPERLDETLRNAEAPISNELWDELDTLCPPEETWLR
ncbi:aldo/keto reductase [Gryllotalpicola protaetiae]|uniref:Aldo/keto reductase n=1 Tax=Gryllotalpicola protaetiae TaxID=2419771 RepID=A0A387BZ76_9MICO|nr:aldo/keto reductase [Gryllotalpicola protaetiae]AYG03631.1 aldo/keto reductase [Gryllotalpicola protaetiae]